MKKIIFLFLGMSIFLFSQDNSELKKQAYKYIQSGRYGEAIEILNKYIPSNPQDASAYDMRGKCYENRSQYEEALEDYKRASKLEPGNNNYKNNVIRIRKNWDDIILKRIEGYKRELFRNPKNYDNYLKIAKCYQDLENYNEAEKWFDDYMSKKELSANDAILYANMLIKANKLKKAESIITAQINKYPQDHRLLSKRGWIRNWLGDYKNAINDFERALVLKPFFKEAQDGLDNAKGKGYNFTIVEKDTGKARFEFAIDKYTRILQKYPNKDDIRFLLIEELLKYKRIGEAQVHLAYLADKYSDKKIGFNKSHFQSCEIQESFTAEEILKAIKKAKIAILNNGFSFVINQIIEVNKKLIAITKIIISFLPNLKPELSGYLILKRIVKLITKPINFRTTLFILDKFLKLPKIKNIKTKEIKAIILSKDGLLLAIT